MLTPGRRRRRGVGGQEGCGVDKGGGDGISRKKRQARKKTGRRVTGPGVAARKSKKYEVARKTAVLEGLVVAP